MTDEEWRTIAPLLPRERGRWARPAQDNRRYVEGMVLIAKTGRPWRLLPKCFGKWGSVYRRYRRWEQEGVWKDVLDRLSKSLTAAGSVQRTDPTAFHRQQIIDIDDARQIILTLVDGLSNRTPGRSG